MEVQRNGVSLWPSEGFQFQKYLEEFNLGQRADSGEGLSGEVGRGKDFVQGPVSTSSAFSHLPFQVWGLLSEQGGPGAGRHPTFPYTAT